MYDVAPLNYQRYTVIYSPLMIPTQSSVAPDTQARVKEVVASNRDGLDLKKQRVYKGTERQVFSSYTQESAKTPSRSGPTSSGTMSPLNNLPFLPDLMGRNVTMTSPADAAGLYATQDTYPKNTIDLKG